MAIPNYAMDDKEFDQHRQLLIDLTREIRLAREQVEVTEAKLHREKWIMGALISAKAKVERAFNLEKERRQCV